MRLRSISYEIPLNPTKPLAYSSSLKGPIKLPITKSIMAATKIPNKPT